MKHQHRPTIQNKERGQSLLEVALFLPIFIILLAGLVEVSQLVVAQNRVTNAARVGARFAANGGEDVGMVDTALNSITQTLKQDESVWDIWSIRAKVAETGASFEEWSFTHIYGISNTTRFPNVDEDGIKSQVLAELQTGGHDATAGIRIVAAYMIHDVDSILGLNALPAVAKINSVQELSVMRITGMTREASIGCDAFPIAVHEGIRSVTQPGEGSDPFPNPNEFDINSPKPSFNAFSRHVENIPLADAKEGYVYKIRNGFGEGNFGWLRWNQGRPNDAVTLLDSLTWPGNSKDYSQVSGGSGLPIHGRVNGYVEPNDVNDTSLHIGDYVAANTGTVNSNEVRNTLVEHISKERVLRVILWDESTRVGNYGEYRISRFALVRLRGFNLKQSDNWILAEFIRWDTSCGQIKKN